MMLVDANLLLYAANRAAPEHERARAWLDAQLSGSAKVGLPWPSVLAFVRIASSPVALRSPVTPARAWQQVAAWLAAPPAWVPAPTERHADVLRAYLDAPWMTSRLVPDAHLAALAVEHGLTLCSSDGDFTRFPGLTLLNPLAA